MHREIDHLDFYSDALSADEPSAVAAAIRLKGRRLVARVAHGITDDLNQFDSEIQASVPTYTAADFVPVRDWMAEVATLLDGAPPEPMADHMGLIAGSESEKQPTHRETGSSRASSKTQPASVQQQQQQQQEQQRPVCGARPNHLRRASRDTADDDDRAARDTEFRTAQPVHSSGHSSAAGSESAATRHPNNASSVTAHAGLPPLAPSPRPNNLSAPASPDSGGPLQHPSTTRPAPPAAAGSPPAAAPIPAPRERTGSRGSAGSGAKYLLLSPATESGALSPNDGPMHAAASSAHSDNSEAPSAKPVQLPPPPPSKRAHRRPSQPDVTQQQQQQLAAASTSSPRRPSTEAMPGVLGIA